MVDTDLYGKIHSPIPEHKRAFKPTKYLEKQMDGNVRI